VHEKNTIETLLMKILRTIDRLLKRSENYTPFRRDFKKWSFRNGTASIAAESGK
jgi:hypothetical protein